MTRAIEVDGLLIAHGSPDPRHAVALRRLAAQVADAVAPMACHIAFLDHDEPPLSDWIESRQHLRLRAIGLLLSSGYHARVDIPRALESATDVEDLGTLGSGEWLPPVLERNVADVGETPESPVVLVAAGSTEVSARADLVAASDLWQASRPGRVLTAAVSGPDPRPEEVIASLGSAASETVVVPFMLAPGALADRAAAAAQSAGVPCAATITAKDRTPPELVAHLAHRLQPT